MREVLFRGKMSDGGWISGGMYHAPKHHRKNEPTNIIPWLGKYVPVKPETVGQYIGLKDVKGYKIFEGDILKVFDRHNNVWSLSGAEVVFSYGYAGGWVLTSDGITFLNIGTRTKHVKIIGNIHDSPELLKKETEETP